VELENVPSRSCSPALASSAFTRRIVCRVAKYTMSVNPREGNVAKKMTETKVAEQTPPAQPNSQAGTETVAGYFRKLFEENPSWLKERSNQALLDRWLQDHPGEKTVPERIKQNLSNVKSVLRKKLRKKPGRPKKEAQPTETTAAPVQVSRKNVRALEALEERIDACLDMARRMDAEGLSSVIGHLRRARNEVVWKLGE